MSKCDLNIVLDDPERRYAVGERITGRVEVDVNASCKCDALTLRWEWRTHGRGTPQKGGRTEIVLYRGNWSGGHTESYPFSFEAPAGPVTYHGRYLNVDWYLHAAADIPWAFDPKTEREFLLVPPPAGAVAQIVSQGPEFRLGAGKHPGSTSSALLVVVGVVFAAPGLLMMTQGGFAFGLVSVLIGGALIYFPIRNRLALHKLGRLRVQLEPRILGKGGKLRCTVMFRPTGSVEIDRVQASLRGYESVTYTQGTDTHTVTHDLHRKSFELCGGRRVGAGEEVALETSISIPEGAPPSFEAERNSLRWEVRIDVSIPGWPDYTQDYALSVLP